MKILLLQEAQWLMLIEGLRWHSPTQKWHKYLQTGRILGKNPQFNIEVITIFKDQTRRDEVILTEVRKVFCLQNLTAKQELGREGSP